MRHTVIIPGGVNRDGQEETDWMIDENGKKYRMVGSIKEFMPTITIDGVEVEDTPETVSAFNEMRKASVAAHHAQEKKRRQENNTGRFCPFYRDDQVLSECKRDCALYLGDSCSLTADKAERDTKGLSCPLMRKCVTSCAAYKDGCTLINNKHGKRV